MGFLNPEGVRGWFPQAKRMSDTFVVVGPSVYDYAFYIRERILGCGTSSPRALQHPVCPEEDEPSETPKHADIDLTNVSAGRVFRLNKAPNRMKAYSRYPD